MSNEIKGFQLMKNPKISEALRYEMNKLGINVKTIVRELKKGLKKTPSK